MREPATRRRFLGGAAVAALSSLAGCTGATPFVGKRIEDERTVDIEDATVLEISVDIGEVHVRSDQRDTVGVHMVKKASSVTADLSDLRLHTERTGARLRLVATYDDENMFFGGTPTMDLSGQVPESFPVSAVETSVGDVDVAGVVGDLSATASTGDVTVRDVDGVVDASASTGDVVVEGATALGDVETSTGDLELAVPAIDGDTRFETSTGDVVAELATDLDAAFTASTNVGDVDVTGLSLEDSTSSATSVSRTLGDGGPSLRLETQTGDVTVSPL